MQGSCPGPFCPGRKPPRGRCTTACWHQLALQLTSRVAATNKFVPRCAPHPSYRGAPHILCAGPPKQFAVSVGVLFSTIIVVLQFTHQWKVGRGRTVVHSCL